MTEDDRKVVKDPSVCLSQMVSDSTDSDGVIGQGTSVALSASRVFSPDTRTDVD